MKIYRYIIPLILIFLLYSGVDLRAQIDNRVYKNSACGLNIISWDIKITDRTASVETAPHDMPVSFVLTGFPSDCYRIEHAYVWWSVSYRSGSPSNPTVTLTNPANNTQTFNSVLAGEDRAKCWGEVGTRAFRADLADAITGNGQYEISVSTPQWETDGITLLVIYRDLEANYEGHIVIDDGIVTKNTNTTFDTLRNFNACANSTKATAFMVASDLQRNAVSADLFLTLNGSRQEFGRDFWNSEFVSTNVSENQSSSVFGIEPGNDCYSWLVKGLYYQTNTCTDCPVRLNLNAQANPDTICAGGPVGLTANRNADTYRWTSDPPGFNSNSRVVTDNPTENTTYFLKGTAENGCILGYDTVKVVVYEQPEIDAGEDVEICNGSSVDIGNQASGGKTPYTYSWSPSAGLSDADIAQPAASPNQTTTYRVTVTDDNGCMAVDQVTIKVFENPTASAGGDVEICFGDTTVIGQQAADGTPPYEYSWSPTKALSDPNIASPEAYPEQSTVYTVTVTDANGCESTDDIEVVVHELPQARAGNDTSVCYGLNANIGEPAAGGTPPYTYNWTPAAGLSDPTAAQPQASPEDTTTYIVQVEDANGCTTYDTVTVSIMPLPEPVITAEGPTRICTCDSVVLDAGAGYDSYLWSTNETTRKITVNEEDNYTVTVVDGNGCENTSDPIYVSLIHPSSVISLPKTDVSAEPGEMVSIPLYIESSQKLDSCHAANFTAVISMNRSLLVPKNTTPKGTITGDTREITITDTRTPGDSILFDLDFRSTLGNDSTTTLTLESFIWNDCPFDVTTNSSQFNLINLCGAGGITRLYFPDQTTAAINVVPNPTNSWSELYYYIPEDSRITINVHNILGEKVKKVISRAETKGIHSIEFDAGDLQSGVYYIMLRTSKEACTTIMEVE